MFKALENVTMRGLTPFTVYEPMSASATGRFKLYFYDQFADAADISHLVTGAQEFNGIAQFDELGAWGKNMIKIGVNQ